MIRLDCSYFLLMLISCNCSSPVHVRNDLRYCSVRLEQRYPLLKCSSQLCRREFVRCSAYPMQNSAEAQQLRAAARQATGAHLYPITAKLSRKIGLLGVAITVNVSAPRAAMVKEDNGIEGTRKRKEKKRKDSSLSGLPLALGKNRYRPCILCCVHTSS